MVWLIYSTERLCSEISKLFPTITTSYLRIIVVFSTTMSTIWTISFTLFISNINNLVDEMDVLKSIDMSLMSFASLLFLELFFSQVFHISGVIEALLACETSSFSAVFVFAVKECWIIIFAPLFGVVSQRTTNFHFVKSHSILSEIQLD